MKCIINFLNRQDKINDEEENLITQFETCPLPEKATLLKKVYKYIYILFMYSIHSLFNF